MDISSELKRCKKRPRDQISSDNSELNKCNKNLLSLQKTIKLNNKLLDIKLLIHTYLTLEENLIIFKNNAELKNKLLNTYYKKIIFQWLTEINVQTPLSEIPNDQIPLLWNLYQNRVNNGPAKDLLEQAINKGLDCHIFYAKEVEYADPIEGLPKDLSEVYYDQSQKYIKLINQKLCRFIDSNKLRKGDFVRLKMYLGRYDEDADYYRKIGAYLPTDFDYSRGLLVFDGQKLISLIYDTPDGEDQIAKNPLELNNFPITSYFTQVMGSIDYKIKFTIEDKTQLRLVNIHRNQIQDKTGQIIEYDGFYEYKYQNYKIYAPKKLQDIKDFYECNSSGFEIDYYISNVLKTKFENDQSLRILFYCD